MSIYGYSGLSANIDVQLPANYLVSNNNRSELNIFVLVPGSEKEMITIGKHSYYSRINIFIPSLEERFLTTAVNIHKGLHLLKKVQCIFPTKPTVTTCVSFEIDFNAVKNYMSPYSDISVEYKMSKSSIQPGEYDIYDFIVRSGDRNIFVSTYMTIDKLITMHNDTTIDEIHMEYNNTLYSGLTYLTMSRENKKLFKKRLHICKFNTETEFNEAEIIAEKNNICIGFSVPNMF